MDDSGLYLMDHRQHQNYLRAQQQGLHPPDGHGQYRQGQRHPHQSQLDHQQDYPEQEEEYEGEYTINDEINPDDLIRTMDPAQIDKFIPKRPFAHIAKNNKSLEKDTCTICLDFLKNGDLLREIPLCKHVFHAECLLSWLQVNEICPNCKNEVSIFTLRAYFESLRQSRKDSPKKKEEKTLKLDPSTNQGNPMNQSLEVIHTRFNPSTAPHQNRNVARVNVQDDSENAGMDWNSPAYQVEESNLPPPQRANRRG